MSAMVECVREGSRSMDVPAPAINADNGEPLTAGQRWAYRKGVCGTVACVEVVRIGTSRPPRVRVRFVEDEYEGKEDWVPPSRLKVRWEHVAAWKAREDRWAAVREVSAHVRGTPEEGAAGWVFDSLPDWDYARRKWNRDSGILIVTDIDGLVADLGIELVTLVDDPSAFTDDDGSLVLPWQAMESIAKVLARKYADRLLPELEKEELEQEHNNRWGYMSSSGFISAEICSEVDQEFRPARQIVREWCGAEARERQDELVALRSEVRRLGQLIERAITALRDGGSIRVAHQLERDLGVPVEVLRQANKET